MNYTPSQQAAIDSDAPIVCVPAGAGSGKTRVLIDRMIRLIREKNVNLDNIVAITFTEKAAAEMKERLRLAFHDEAPQDDQVEMNRWRHFERRASSARVSTIHAFCASILRQHALRLGFDPDFRQQTEADTTLGLNQCLDTTLTRLQDAQSPAMVHLSATMTLSTLKSYLSLLFRKHRLIEPLLKSWPLDDPKKLLHHWEGLLKGEHQRQLMALKRSMKFNAFIYQLHEYDGNCQDHEDGCEVRRQSFLHALETMQHSNEVAILEEHLNALASPPRLSPKKGEWTTPEARQACKDCCDDIKEWAKAKQPKAYTMDVLANATGVGHLLTVFNEAQIAYGEYKAQANVRDFDDLISTTRQVLQENETLRHRVAKNIDYLFMDEFQDTDAVQLDIARLLHDSPEGPDLFIVGDVKQSIYGFRGAEVEVFKTEIEAADDVHTLAENFRTLPEVLNFINHFFTKTGLLNAVEDYQGMVPCRPARGESRVEILDLPKHKIEDPRRQAEAALLANRIQHLCGEQGIAVQDEKTDQWRSATYGDVALLFQKMSIVHYYVDALKALNIPYTIVDGKGFYRKQEIVDVLNCLKVLINPYDEAALTALLRGPLCALSDDSLVQLVENAPLRNAALDYPIPDTLEQGAQLQGLRDLLHDLQAHIHQPIPQLLQALYLRTNIEAILLSMHHGLQRMANLRKLVDLAQDFTDSQSPTLRAFITWIDQLSNQEIREGDALLQAETSDAVTLMTIHKSKGLEFPIVALPDMGGEPKDPNTQGPKTHRHLGLAIRTENAEGNTELAPLGHAIQQRIQEDEEAERARKLYVAMTRARDYLILCNTQGTSLNTWSGALNTYYKPDTFPDQGKMNEADWSATIHRTLGSAASINTLKADPKPDSAVLHIDAAQYQPLLLKDQPVTGMSVSRLLDLLNPRPECEVESTKQTSEKKPLIDPLLRGTLVHAMFEYWDFDTAPPIERILSTAGLSPDQYARLQEDLESIALRFAESPCYTLLKEAPIVYREHPFTLRTPQVLINGTIDAMLPDYTLIDYKTGQHNPDNEARYKEQLGLYALAIHQLTGTLPPCGYIAYVDAGTTTTLTFTDQTLQTLQEKLNNTLQSK